MEYEKFSLELFNHLTNATEKIIAKLFNNDFVEFLSDYEDGFYLEQIDGMFYCKSKSELENSWFKGFKILISDDKFIIRDNIYKYNYKYIIDTNCKSKVDVWDGHTNTIYNSEDETLIASALVEFLIVAYEVYDYVNYKGEK